MLDNKGLKRLGASLMVVAIAIVVGTLGYFFPKVFPELAQRGEDSDQYNAWLQILVFGVAAVIILVRTLEWTWLGRGIVWSYLGIVSVYLIVVAREQEWESMTTSNWLWTTRFLIAFGGVVSVSALVMEEYPAVVYRLKSWQTRRLLRRHSK